MATGSQHNIDRSKTMLSRLMHIGISDTPQNREYMSNILKKAFQDRKINGFLQDNGRYIVDSILSGPGGTIKMQSIWEENRLITIIL